MKTPQQLQENELCLTQLGVLDDETLQVVSKTRYHYMYRPV